MSCARLAAISSLASTPHAYIASSMHSDYRHRRTRTRDGSSALIASTSSLSLSASSSSHKRATSLGVAPHPARAATHTSLPPSNLAKGHKRASSNQPLQTPRSRAVLGDSSTGYQQNMPSIPMQRRSPPACKGKTKTRRDESPAWTDDRQRGLELQLGLMGDAGGRADEQKFGKVDLAHDPDFSEYSCCTCITQAARKIKSTDAMPLSRSPIHRSRHSLGPGIPTPFSALSRCSSPLQVSKTARSTPAKSSTKNRPPPLRDLPPPSWSCPGPSPPLTGLAQPFPNECWIIHVPSPINAVIAAAVSPPATPERHRHRFELQDLREHADLRDTLMPTTTLRRRRSSLSSFESSTSTIRPPAWYSSADAASELTPRASRHQLLHEAQHDTFNLPVAPPSQRKRRLDRETGHGSVPVEDGDDVRGRGRRRVRGGGGSVDAQMDSGQGGWTQAIGGWLG